MSIVDPPKVWAPCPIELFRDSWTIRVDGGPYHTFNNQSDFDVLAALVIARLKSPQDPPRFNKQELFLASGWKHADRVFERLAALPLLVDILDPAQIQRRKDGWKRNFGCDQSGDPEYGWKR